VFIKDPTAPHMHRYSIPCETLMPENEREMQTNAVINDKLQDTVVTYLRRGGIFNNQLKEGLLVSLAVKKIEIGKYLI